MAATMKSIGSGVVLLFVLFYYLSVSTDAVYGISAEQDLTLTGKELQALQEVFKFEGIFVTGDEYFRSCY